MSPDIMLMGFEKDNTREIIESIGFQIKNTQIIGEGGEVINCACCDKPLDIENIGHIIPGSIQLYCDDPFCFNKFAITLV